MQFEAFGKTFTFGKKAVEDVDFDEEGDGEEVEGELEDFSYEVGIPTVNAIPDAIIRKYQVRGVVKQYGFILGIIVGGFVAISILTSIGLAIQASSVDRLNEERDTLKQEAALLSPYQEYKAAVDGKRGVLASVTESDVNYGILHGEIRNAADANRINLETLNFTQFSNAEGETGSCVSPDPLGTTSGIVGCASITALTPDEGSVVTFLNQLQQLETPAGGFALPSVSSFSTNDEGISKVEMSIFVTSEFYSKKYKKLSVSMDELLANAAATEADAPKEKAPLDPEAVFAALTAASGVTTEADENALGAVTNAAADICETGSADSDQAKDALQMLTNLFNLSDEEVTNQITQKC